MKNLFVLSSMAALLALVPVHAQAMDCSDAEMQKLHADIDATTDATKKAEATKHMNMAMESMQKKDTKGCVGHMEEAMKAAGK